MADTTPMMDQYRSIKARHRDAVLFFRLGDFYEMFFEDALEVSSLLNLTLTRRQGEPMCGIPYHAAKSYIARLLRLGKKIAICEQLEQPQAGKGIVKRDVVEIVTPGTTLEEDFLDQASNNYLACACRLQDRMCYAWLDVSTGEFRAQAVPDPECRAGGTFLSTVLARTNPRELLIQQSLFELKDIATVIASHEDLMVGSYPEWSFDIAGALRDLSAHFGVASLKGFGFRGDEPELAAAGLLLQYVLETLKTRAPQIGSLLPYQAGEFVGIDESSAKNLELLRNLQEGGKGRSLLGVLDETRSAPGARLLRQWLLEPLTDRKRIEERLDAVEFLYHNQNLLASLREKLSRVLDLERLASRTATDRAHARDLLAIRDSVMACNAVRVALSEASAPEILITTGDDAVFGEASRIAELIGRAIRDEPSVLLSEGDIIRAGYDSGLDALQALRDGSATILAAYLEEEKQRSGISNLRIRNNKIIGYYLEVSRGRLDSVPAHFIRRQSLVNGERYSTERLASLESEIEGATEKIVALERNLFLDLREKVKASLASLLLIGSRTARIDCLVSFAWVATSRGYSRPVLHEESLLDLREARHPVVEAWAQDTPFVPNDLRLDPEGACFALITGPNMAGKSTFLRQTALIVLMAQCGSFVPAAQAHIGLVDRIFCRVGAQDNLARGESTFLVEMNETAHILNTATCRSLVIMDEVGRGTGTMDGLSIAWAVSERLIERTCCRTLFATHYHELTAMKHARLINLSPAVLEKDDTIVFLKKIQEKAATGSFGIHVARIAGMPQDVIARAKAIRERLVLAERSLPVPHDAAGSGQPATTSMSGQIQEPQPLPQSPGVSRKGGKGGAIPASHAQAELFDTGDMILSRLAQIPIESMTPLSALNLLAEFRASLQSERRFQR